MHNTYITSSVSLKTKASLLSSSSFNDYRSYYLRNDRFDKTPLLLCHSSCCNCCPCCSFNQRVPINPSFVLYGLRQSSLVQLGHCRRLVFGCGDQCYSRVRVCRVGGDSYGASCLVKESRVVDGTRRRLKGSLGSKDLKERRKLRCSAGENEAELMLSLLIEETGEESFDSFKKVKVEKRETVGDHGRKKKKNNRETVSLQSDSKFEFESDGNKSREEGYRRNVKKNERSSRVENRIARTEGSYGSSYYSCVSDDDFESEMEAKSTNEEHIVDSSNLHTSNKKKFGRSSVEIECVAKLESERDDKDERQEVSKQQSTVGGSYPGGSNVNWDVRKKSEKKLSEVSMDKTEKLNLVENSNQEIKRRISRQDIDQSKSRINYRHDTESITEESKDHNSQKIYTTDAQIISNSQKQFHDREDDVHTAVNLVQRRRNAVKNEQINIESITEEGKDHNSQKIYSADAQIISNSQKQFHDREDDVHTAVNLVQRRRNTVKNEQINIESITEEGKDHNSQKIYSADAQIISNSQKQFHDREDDVHTSANLVQRRRNTVKNEQINVSQRQSEIRMKKQEENSTSISSSVEGMSQEKLYKKGQVSTGQVGSRRNSVQINDESYRYDEKSSTSRLQLEDRMKKQEERSQVISSLLPEAKQRYSRTDTNDDWRSEQRLGSHNVASSSVVRVSDTERVTSSTSISKSKTGSQESYITSSDGHNQTDERQMQIGLSKHPQKLFKASTFHESTSKEASRSRLQEACVQDRDTRSSQAMLIPPPPQLVETEETSSIYVYPQREDSALHGIVYSGDEGSAMHREAVRMVAPDDALGSADRLEKSSMQFVGDFVERIRHEVSTSEIIKENLFSETKLGHKKEKKTEERESNLSSGASETKGSSNEKWDLAESSAQEIPKTETHTPEGSVSTGSTIARRNSKSLWSVVADIFRFKWTTHSQNHTIQTKSSVKSSSNESVSSDPWFSGREPESSDQSEIVKAPVINQEKPDLGKAKEEISLVVVDPSSALGIPEMGSTSLGKFLVPGEENLSSSGNGARNEGAPSSSTIIHTSFPSSFRQLRRSPAVDVIYSTDKDDPSESGLMEQHEFPQSERPTEGKDGELKRRKLQRNSQLPKDRFDEWEEAYMHESEIRKLDEMFMREALIEARKAADAWEVPVGAVLVQHGKIIARGFNLVEELRDSTAHAEMICIREASNLLKSWRLADTTLYVTLEPCPMCAGAILQARVDTVVWGAPNKLLGADGSWIRLFPNGGESDSEQTDKPPPPVHPFHPNMKVRRGVLATECADIMQQFFQLRRKKKSPDPPTPPPRLNISHHPSKIISKVHNLFNITFCL